MLLPSESPSLLLQLGSQASEPKQWALGLPVLRGLHIEDPFADSEAATQLAADSPFSLFHTGDFLFGVAQVCILPSQLSDQTETLYRDLLACLGDHAPCRIWNYVPAINKHDTHGLENYRAFCRGRAHAFEASLGTAFEQQLCAASAVGTDSDLLTIAFAAHRSAASAFENPLQVPAYAYPACYGPRPPSFARASIVPAGPGLRHAFVSGTASIRGHETIAPGDTASQLTCTLENLAAIGQHCGIGADLAAGRCASRWIKVYLRHASEIEAVASALQSTLLAPGDCVSYLRSDICRADLNIEIEVSALGVNSAGD